MPADGGVNRRIFFRQPDGALAAFQIRADGNHFGDAGGLGAGDDFRKILLVFGIIEMGVGVVKNGHKDSRN